MADAGSDGEVLAKAAQGDERAFEELVLRHGPLVLGACLRILKQREEAEDAAQAVFIALARKAGDRSLQARSSLAGWLYQTAWFVSLRSKEARVLQKRHEQEAARQSAKDVASEGAWNEIAPLLDRALNELPEKFRQPIVLHHLKGLPAAAVGSAMNCSEQAVKHRLVRGREMLRERLARWGVKTSASALSVAISANALGAPLPEAFASATAKAAGLAAGGKLAAAGLSIKVNSLAEGGLKMMLMAKVKAAALFLVAAGVAGGAIGVTAYQVFAGENAAPKTAVTGIKAEPVPAPEWPGWRGPHRNGASDETGFEWPKEGPRKAWRAPANASYGGVAVKNGRVYYGGSSDPKGQSQYQAEIGCLDAKTGKELWRVPVGKPSANFHATPAADDTAVYAINNKGWLAVLDATSGKTIWEKDLVVELSLKNLPGYGIATSPLLIGDTLVVGGAAFEKKTGKKLWIKGFSPIPSTGLVRVNNKDAALCLTGDGLDAVNPADGSTLWSFNRKDAYGISPNSPLYLDPLPFESFVYFVSGYGGAVIQVKDQPAISGKPTVGYGYTFAQLTLWNGCAIGGEAGAGDGNITGHLACVDIKTGKALWDHNEYASSHLYVDGKFVIQTLAGDLIIAEASNAEYKEVSKTPIVERGRPYDYSKGDRPLVTAPAFCDGRIFCRTGGEIVCFEVARKK